MTYYDDKQDIDMIPSVSIISLGLVVEPFIPSIIPQSLMITSFETLPLLLPHSSISSSTSIPWSTVPKTVCLPSSHAPNDNGDENDDEDEDEDDEDDDDDNNNGDDDAVHFVNVMKN